MITTMSYAKKWVRPPSYRGTPEKEDIRMEKRTKQGRQAILSVLFTI